MINLVFDYVCYGTNMKFLYQRFYFIVPRTIKF